MEASFRVEVLEHEGDAGSRREVVSGPVGRADVRAAVSHHVFVVVDARVWDLVLLRR